MSAVGNITQTPRMPDWTGAACIGMDIRVFIADSENPQQFNATDAKTVCRECPIRRACRDYAVADPRLVGVWGGTTSKERAAWRARGASRA